MKIEIIKATRADAEVLAVLGKQSYLESQGTSASIEDVNNFILKTENKETIVQELENTNVQYHIMYCNEKPAGFSKIEFNTSNKNINELPITKLDRLYLLKDFYGQKLGAKLFNLNLFSAI